jgi:hypothetical protein
VKGDFGNSLSKPDILKSRRGQEHGPLLEANVSAESVHFMQNSSGSGKGILDFIAVFG